MKRLILILLLLSSGISLGADKTPAELCRERNAASCEINGLKFFMTEQECPRGAKVLRNLGHENCNQLASPALADIAKPEVSARQEPSIKDSETAADKGKAGGHIFGNPYFIIALIGLVQGMISRVSVGSLSIVMLVMPLIATWSVFSEVKFAGGIADNLGYIGMEWLGMFLFSMSGWAVGALIRKAAYRILLGH